MLEREWGAYAESREATSQVWLALFPFLLRSLDHHTCVPRQSWKQDLGSTRSLRRVKMRCPL